MDVGKTKPIQWKEFTSVSHFLGSFKLIELCECIHFTSLLFSYIKQPTSTLEKVGCKL